MSVEVRREQTTGSAVRVGVLVWLTVQNSVHTLLIRYSRAREVDAMFFSSVAVFSMEVLKMGACLLVVVYEASGFVSGMRVLKKQVVGSPGDTLKTCIPAMLYTFQNNLVYVAASHLDAATFMLTRSQWISLGVLFAGVLLVQMQQGTRFAAACTACTISGFAGVFFEKILKGSAPVSLWMRNVQMGVFAIPASFVGALLTDGAAIRANGLLFGFDGVVWASVGWYAVGGLSVAVCIKYADNIAKNFATSFAIVLATIGSVFLFGFQPTAPFVVGAALVISSIFLYSSAGLFTAYVRPATKV
ncbi:ARF7EP-C domain-containing protein [Aphelenchoides fujianensis]|nr:ARF7EP-C domain-containing protein [Aphelenchoides fujianensis]